jgi:hypothetical protein
MNRNVVLLLLLTAVVVVGVVAGLAGWSGEIVNRWTLIAAVPLIILVFNIASPGRRREPRTPPTDG